MTRKIGQKFLFKVGHYFIMLAILNSCASYEKFKYITKEFELPAININAPFHQTWAAVVQVMKKYDLSYQNQEAGVIKSRWIDNTSQLNFSDSFGGKDAVKSAKFKLVISVIKGQRFDQEISKVTIFKRQLVEQDLLQGWKEIPTDSIQENTMLYRIVRIIEIDKKLKKLDKIAAEKNTKVKNDF